MQDNDIFKNKSFKGITCSHSIVKFGEIMPLAPFDYLLTRQTEETSLIFFCSKKLSLKNFSLSKVMKGAFELQLTKHGKNTCSLTAIHFISKIYSFRSNQRLRLVRFMRYLTKRPAPYP